MEPQASAPADRSPEGVDGDRVFYEEHLRPRIRAWIGVAAAAAMLAVAYFVALGPLAAAITFAVIAGFGVWLIWRSTVTLRIDDKVLRVGAARLPLRFAGRVRALDASEAQIVRGPGADAQAFHVLRVGYSPLAVAVEVTDPADPHPYWLISTRHPERVVSAMMEARTAESTDHDPRAEC